MNCLIHELYTLCTFNIWANDTHYIHSSIDDACKNFSFFLAFLLFSMNSENSKFNCSITMTLSFVIVINLLFAANFLTRKTFNRFSNTYNGCYVIRVYCYGYTLDYTRSSCRLYWIEGDLFLFQCPSNNNNN